MLLELRSAVRCLIILTLILISQLAAAHGPATILISWSKACHKLLASRVTPVEVRVDSGPVHQQCGPTCQFEAAAAHLQNLTSERFNLDYLNIIRLRRFTNLYPNSDDLGHLLDEVRRYAGLLPQDGFGFPEDVRRDLLAWAADPKSKYQGRLTLIEIFVARIRQHHERIREYNERGSFEGMALSIGEALTMALFFDQTLAGVRPGFDARAYTARMLPEPGWRISQVALNSDFSAPVDPGRMNEAVRLIRQTINGRRNLILHYKSPAYFDGAKQIDRPSQDQIKWFRAHAQSVMGHAAVIDGYRRGVNGEVEWLIIKNSHGHQSYDGGYHYMHVKALALYGIAILKLGR